MDNWRKQDSTRWVWWWRHNFWSIFDFFISFFGCFFLFFPFSLFFFFFSKELEWFSKELVLFFFLFFSAGSSPGVRPRGFSCEVFFQLLLLAVVLVVLLVLLVGCFFVFVVTVVLRVLLVLLVLLVLRVLCSFSSFSFHLTYIFFSSSCLIVERRTRRSSRRRTSRREPSSITWRSMRRPHSAVEIWDWLSPFPRERISTSGSLSTVHYLPPLLLPWLGWAGVVITSPWCCTLWEEEMGNHGLLWRRRRRRRRKRRRRI